MALAKELLVILNNEEEPLTKRLKIADTAFKSSEFPLQQREAFLLSWIVKISKASDNESWAIFNSWLASDQFKELSRNDIDNEKINNLIELIIKKLTTFTEDHVEEKNIVLKSLPLLLDNRIFQQNFKFNIKNYCTFVSHIISNIDCPENLVEFIKNPNVFSSDLITVDKFYKHFIEINLPHFVKTTLKFNGNELVFEEISKIVQKVIFHKNHRKSFENYLNKFFEESESAEKYSIPKSLFKYLLSSYELETEEAKYTFRLILFSLCRAYSDYNYMYKSIIIFFHILGFNFENKFIKNNSSKITNNEAILSKSLEIMNELFLVISINKNNSEHKIMNISFHDFLMNILKSVMFLKKPNSSTYNILMKTIIINPLIIESLINEIISYTLLANNDSLQIEYENLLIAIFEVFSKLHRTQNLLSKMIRTLNAILNEEMVCEEIYCFTGIDDIHVKKVKHHNIENILPINVLNYYSTCVTNLASWQVINLFKTFQHHLDSIVEDLPNISNDSKKLVYIEFLTTLMSWLLSSVRVAEHTITSTIVEKFIKGLEDLRQTLSKFGSTLLNREHNHVLMRAFLNISYNWADIYVTLHYYSINNEVNLKKALDNDYNSCNITYLHSYLTSNQWCLISERITNFGEKPCKLLMQKLMIQKIKAMLIFENSLNEDIVTDVIKNLCLNLEDNCKELLADKYVVSNLLPKIDTPSSIKLLAEEVISDNNSISENILKYIIADSQCILNAINYVTLHKINKLFKHKRKLDEGSQKKPFSPKIFSAISEDVFLSNCDGSEIVNNVKEMFTTITDYENYMLDLKLSEEKIAKYFSILKKYSIISSSKEIQELYLLYLLSLHKDIYNSNFSEEIKRDCEILIIGILQCCKIRLLDLFEANTIIKEIICNYTRYDAVFGLLIENVFKQENSIEKLEPGITYISKNMKSSNHLHCSLTILNAVNKNKKQKMSAKIKTLANTYKSTICNKIVELVSKKDPDNSLIEAYAHVLKNMLQKDENKSLEKLLGVVDSYVNFALDNLTDENIRGYVMLFSTILHHKSQIKQFDEGFPLKVWNACKGFNLASNDSEEFSQLIILIFEHIPNDEFTGITTDLLQFTVLSIKENNFTELIKHLNTWKYILSCSLNPTKIKIWQNILESLVQKLLGILQNNDDEILMERIIQFEEKIINTHQLLLSPALIDMFLLNTTILWSKENVNFVKTFNISIKMMNALLKSRKPLVMDRLATYLQQYRLILKKLCINSNSDLVTSNIQQVSDCAHQLEKLTNNLVSCQKDMARISPYLIADIIEQYEQVTLYPIVKIHLNNCLYGLISLCDQHAISYLMRALSSASTEIFKILYENYKKYYRFTGKV